MFELRARTLNIDIRRTFDAIRCTMTRTVTSHKQQHHYHTTLLDAGYRTPYELGHAYPIQTFDENGNELNDQHQLQQRLIPSTAHNSFDREQQQQQQHSQQQLPQAEITTQLVSLIELGAENLPCPRLRAPEPTELPLPRESIGLDLSWLSSNVGVLNGATRSAATANAMMWLLSGAVSATLAVWNRGWRQT